MGAPSVHPEAAQDQAISVVKRRVSMTSPMTDEELAAIERRDATCNDGFSLLEPEVDRRALLAEVRRLQAERDAAPPPGGQTVEQFAEYLFGHEMFNLARERKITVLEAQAILIAARETEVARAAAERAYPDSLTPALQKALSPMVWESSAIAQAMRHGGLEIPNKAELEQAHVLHWLTMLALKHGDRWPPAAAAQLNSWRSRAPAPAGEARSPVILCEDCPPGGYPTDVTRCDGCPRTKATAGEG